MAIFYRTRRKGWPYDGDKSIALWRSGFVQKPRTNEPNDYDGQAVYRVKNVGANYFAAYTSGAREAIDFYGTGTYSLVRARLHNKALSKLRSQITEFTQQGENLGQAASTMKMVRDRANQVFQGYKHLRKGQLGLFCEVMRVLPQKKHDYLLGKRRRVQKQAAGLFLEYHYGWTPLLNDIYAGLNALVDAPVWDRRIEAKASSGNFALDKRGVPWAGEYHDGTATYYTRLACAIRVTDPNLYSLNKTGLINPLQVAWQLTPFSFIVDWFVNVEQYLGSLTDWMGLGIRTPLTSDKAVANSVSMYNDPYDHWEAVFKGYSLARRTSLPQVVLVPAEWKGLSVTRAAVAVSLVVQLMSGKGDANQKWQQFIV